MKVLSQMNCLGVVSTLRLLKLCLVVAAAAIVLPAGPLLATAAAVFLLVLGVVPDVSQAAPGDYWVGIVPVEAQACGRPVVALARGGALETVRDGVTGVLVPDPTAEAVAEAGVDLRLSARALLARGRGCTARGAHPGDYGGHRCGDDDGRPEGDESA